MSGAQTVVAGKRHHNAGKVFGRPFQKGQVANPSGKPKKGRAIGEIAREACPEAIRQLIKIMRDPKATHSVRAFCAERILDRGLGKPVQVAAVALTDTRQLRDMSDAELLAILQGEPAPQGPVIEGTCEPAMLGSE